MKYQKSITRNFIYNLLYQLFLIIVPIAVTPYIARVLGEDASGQYSFTNSVNYYYTLLAMLGFNLYGQRLIASHQNEVKQQTIDFIEILLARSVSTLLSIIIYFLMIWQGPIDDRYRSLLFVQIINIVSVGFDIAFFFQGNEEFGKIILRNVIIKSFGIISIFLFVKSPDHLFIYAFIQSLITLFSSLSLWIYLPKVLIKVEKESIKPFRHIKPAFLLFLPTIATSVYTSLDRTLIGIITKLDSENGNYVYAERIVKMALVVVTSLGTVLVPRNSARFEKGDILSVRKNIEKSARFVFFMGTPLVFGCIAIAPNFIPWYLGDGYIKAILLMQILSPIILIIGLSNVFGIQYLIPSKNDKKYTLAIVIGAISNFILNLCLITLWMSYGAAIATLIAETLVTCTMGYMIRKDIDLKKIIKSSIHYIIASVIMFVLCFFEANRFPPQFGYSIIIITSGILIYLVSLFIVKDELLLQIISRIKNMLKQGRSYID